MLTASLLGFGQMMNEFTSTSELQPAVAALRQLLDHPCMHWAKREFPLTGPDSAWALKQWWDGTGAAWLREWESIAVARSGPPPYGQLVLRVAEDFRSTLSPEAGKRLAIASLICPIHDAACGSETQGWVQSANRSFEAQSFQRWYYDAVNSTAEHVVYASDMACKEEALKRPPTLRYRFWRACIEGLMPRQAIMPLGHFRAPTSGWLVLRGRRGHYSFCDEVRAYDLGSGAAYLARSCSNLQFGTHGMVDENKVDQSRKISVEAGTIALDPLRHAAWMMMFAPHVKRNARIGFRWHDLPSEIDPGIPDDQMPQVPQPFETRSDAETTLAWSWIVGGRQNASGFFRWPSTSNEAEQHINELLQEAESGVVLGCAPVAAPRISPSAGSLVSPIDASSGSVIDTELALIRALNKIGSLRLCPRNPHPSSV